MIGLDTNVLARYYVASEDAPTQRQSLAAKALIDSGQRLFVAKTVLLELEWVLRGYYKSAPDEVQAVMNHLLGMPNLDIEDRVSLELASAALAQGFDFADALHHASCRHCTSMVTFDDKRFARRAHTAGWNPQVKVLGGDQ